MNKTEIAEKLLNNSELITETGCRIWLMNIDHKGYGKVSFNGRAYLAHRAAYTVFVGDIPYGKFILHKCDVRCCLNELHLYVGTAADNNRDCELRNRGNHPKGSHHGKSKLTEEQVINIKRKLLAGEHFQTVANAYDVSYGAIRDIDCGRTWWWLNVPQVS